MDHGLGAGAVNFDVVTSLTFRARPASLSMANFHLAWPCRQAAAVIGPGGGGPWTIPAG